jgi:hypothetical protein
MDGCGSYVVVRTVKEKEQLIAKLAFDALFAQLHLVCG